jgi:hypothetical protein
MATFDACIVIGSYDIVGSSNEWIVKGRRREVAESLFQEGSGCHGLGRFSAARWERLLEVLTNQCQEENVRDELELRNHF